MAVAPSFRRRAMVSCKSFRPAMSMPSVGSSSTNSCGSPISAWANANRCNIPLLNETIGSAARSARPNWSSNAGMRRANWLLGTKDIAP